MRAGADADQADALCLLGIEQERGDLLAGADPELGEGGREVALDRALRQQEPFGDLAVGQPPGDESEDLALAVREGRLFDAGAQLAGHDRLAAGDRQGGHCQSGLDLRLEDDRVGARVEGAANAGPGRGRGDDDDRRVALCSPQATKPGHAAGLVDVADEDEDGRGVDGGGVDFIGRREDVGDGKPALAKRADDAPRGCGAVAQHLQLGLGLGVLAQALFRFSLHV